MKLTNLYPFKLGYRRYFSGLVYRGDYYQHVLAMGYIVLLWGTTHKKRDVPK